MELNDIEQRLLEVRVLADNVKITDGRYLSIKEPISLKDGTNFLSAVLPEQGDWSGFFPDGMNLDNFKLESFDVTLPEKKAGGQSPSSPTTDPTPPDSQFYSIGCILGVTDVQWDIIPSVLSVRGFSVALEFGKGYRYGKVSAIINLGDIPISIALELPNTSFEIGTKMPTAEGITAKALFDKFGLAAVLQTASSAGINLETLALKELRILGNASGRRIYFYLSLGNLQIGPGQLSTMFELDYFGGANSSKSGQLYGQYDILRKGPSEEVLFSITLSALFDGANKDYHFKGAATAPDPAAPPSVTDLIAAFADIDGIPGILNDLKIKQLSLAYQTASKKFDLICDVVVDDLFGTDASVEMIVNVHLEKGGAETGAGYNKSFSGQLIFAKPDGPRMEFDLLFDQSVTGNEKDTTFIAAYRAQSGMEVSIEDLVHLIDDSVDVPLTINLKDAFFIYDKKGAAAGAGEGRVAKPIATSLLGMDIGAGVDLSALPLLGKILPKETSLNLDVQPLVAFGNKTADHLFFTQQQLVHLGSLVPGGGIKLPPRDIDEKLGIGVTLSVGSEINVRFDLPIKLKDKPRPASEPTPAPAAAPAEKENAPTPVSQAIEPTDSPVTEMPTAPAAAGVTPAAGDSASGIQWINVNKNFGPSGRR